MKRTILITFVLISFLSPSVAQEKIPAGISLAFRAGNASELAKYLNSTVEILLLDTEDFYKKGVAETILKDFFASYPCTDFTILHQGAKNEAQYAIGNLKSTKGSFRVYFLLKKVGSEFLIHQIRIETDNGR